MGYAFYSSQPDDGPGDQVGLLPPDNSRQIDFAFTVYKSTDPNSAEIGRQFKKIFAYVMSSPNHGMCFDVIPQPERSGQICRGVVRFHEIPDMPERK